MESLREQIEKLRSGTAPEKLDAVHALEKSGSCTEEVRAALAGALREHNWALRSNAAFALGELGCTRAVPELLRALSDENEKVKKSAAKALGMLGSTEAVEPLIRLLDDPAPQVRKSAARSLGQIGDEIACRPLLEHKLDDVGYIRAAIEDAIAKVCKGPKSNP